MKDTRQNQTSGENQETVLNGDSSADELRRQRIADYLAEGLGRDNPLRANLSAVSSDLLQIGYLLKLAIDESLGTEPGLAQFQGLLPALDYWLRVCKQAERFMQLDGQLEKLKQAQKKAGEIAREAE